MEKLLILFFIFSFNNIIYSQQTGYTSTLQELHSKNSINKKIDNSYTDVEGSPYLNDDFVFGILRYENSTYTNLKLRYNIYDDEIEYSEQNIIYTIANKSELLDVKFGESLWTFIANDNKKHSGFFEVLYVKNEIKFIKKYTVKYYKKSPEKPIVGSTPARFVSKASKYYLLINGNIEEVKNKKSWFYDRFYTHKNEIKNFIKKNRLSVKNDNDLIKIIDYCFSL